MNKVILMGRLTRDPEIRYSQGANSLAIARYSLAVNRSFKREGEPDADFFNCTAFGRNAEFAEKYLKQGTRILISGRIQQDNYTNKDGQKVYSVQVIVDEQEFAESKNASGSESGGYQPSARPTPSAAVGDGFMNIPDGIDEELPFN
ncbi:single-stranded DNA-binding protein [Lachnoclostridium phytofermentans]|uniref:Single-stranded DNA-binding protein n=2 Tax=Lachnoclostridium phytofermentans TaxID=66219 RepID=A9KKC9_LACP7|nr:single-stranded DNA-binding protein [Lachnoclostridium phytofermentans]ABX44120.1 single-strand binding protein [Lachnoclostridium phytofermentans ISDg]